MERWAKKNWLGIVGLAFALAGFLLAVTYGPLNKEDIADTREAMTYNDMIESVNGALRLGKVCTIFPNRTISCGPGCPAPGYDYCMGGKEYHTGDNFFAGTGIFAQELHGATKISAAAGFSSSQGGGSFAQAVDAGEAVTAGTRAYSHRFMQVSDPDILNTPTLASNQTAVDILSQLLVVRASLVNDRDTFVPGDESQHYMLYGPSVESILPSAYTSAAPNPRGLYRVSSGDKPTLKAVALDEIVALLVLAVQKLAAETP